MQLLSHLWFYPRHLCPSTGESTPRIACECRCDSVHPLSWWPPGRDPDWLPSELPSGHRLHNQKVTLSIIQFSVWLVWIVCPWLPSLWRRTKWPCTVWSRTRGPRHRKRHPNAGKMSYERFSLASWSSWSWMSSSSKRNERSAFHLFIASVLKGREIKQSDVHAADSVYDWRTLAYRNGYPWVGYPFTMRGGEGGGVSTS